MSTYHGNEPGNLDDALWDHTLRGLLTQIPPTIEGSGDLPPEALAEIGQAITMAWPDGAPPTVDEIAREDDFGDHFDPHLGWADHERGYDVAHGGGAHLGHEEGGHPAHSDDGHHLGDHGDGGDHSGPF